MVPHGDFGPETDLSHSKEKTLTKVVHSVADRSVPGQCEAKVSDTVSEMQHGRISLVARCVAAVLGKAPEKNRLRQKVPFRKKKPPGNRRGRGRRGEGHRDVDPWKVTLSHALLTWSTNCTAEFSLLEAKVEWPL
jgi:hypothetical protein